ncbi:hypothetical protein HDU67_008940 [Dinochytrium kinnereticum]|nr:hypothetical protein HDU67_008940 [Dinochytrium kinnereticum]
MIFSRIVALAAIVASASAELRLRSYPGETPVENAYVFDLASNVDAEAHVTNFFASKGVNRSEFAIRSQYKSDLANIISVEFAQPIDETILNEVTEAFDISRVQYIEKPTPLNIATEGTGKFTPESIHSLTGVNDVRQKLGLTGKGVKVAVIDSGIDYTHEALGGGFGPGFKVSFGYDLVGDRYAGGVGAVADPDPLDNCSSDSHGTHVAGIVAADASAIKNATWATDVPFTGVAPEATLGAYRVFSCAGGGTASDIIAEAIYRAAADGADIINLSLGGGPVFNDFVTSVAATRVSETGTLVISSNGNAGARGTFVGGSPGTAAGGLGIASFDNVNVPKAFVSFEGTKFEYNIGSANGRFNFGVEYDVVINNPEAEEKDILDDGLTAINPDARGKALLIRWGGTSSAGRCNAAARAGAAACILYANTASIPNILGSADVPSMASSRASGLAMLAAFKAGRPVKLTVSNVLGIFDVPTAGTVSDFSSPGLDQELFIKPDLGGIGGEVYSTVSKNSQIVNARRGPYAVYGGTSMSSPYVAGVAALMVQAAGRSKPTFDQLRTALQNTAAGRSKPTFDQLRTALQNTASITNKFRTDLVNSVAYQGAGLVNAYAAITSTTMVYPSRLALNDTRNIHQHYRLTVTNKGTTPLNYTVKHVPALMVTPFQSNDDANLNALDQTYTADYATVRFSRNNDRVESLNFVLTAGASRSFNVHFQPPANAIAGLFPIYSGYVVVDAEGDKVASVPYAGLVGAWRDAPIWVRKSAKYNTIFNAVRPALARIGYPASANATFTTGVYSPADQWSRVIPENSVYNLTRSPLVVLPVASTTTRFARVEVLYRGGNWSALAPFDIKRETQMYLLGSGTVNFNPDAAGNLPTTTGLRLANFIPIQRNSYSETRPTALLFRGFVLTNLTASTVQRLPAGRYQIRFSALKHFGRINAPVGGTDFDTVMSNTFDIAY